MSSKNKSSLGKSLIKDRFGGRRQSSKSSDLHTTDLNDGLDWNKINLKSVTEENTLDEFLSTAELAMTEFVAERQNAVLISESSNLIPTRDEMLKMMKVQSDLKSLLRIPRRPKWDENTNSEQLNEDEKKSFLEWRYSLSKLSEVEGIVITPYEKNLEFWRQLWRVIERSNVVVQIVDARNPLLFRCEDLEIYVKEIDPKKENVLLINKADFLNESQRKMWVDYFKDFKITVLFWSAINELNEGQSKEMDENVDDDEYESNPVLSAAQLLEWFRYIGNKIKGNSDELVTVGLIGYPNVGKSSTINALLANRVIEDPSAKPKHHQAPVSATPGKTKHFQTFFIDSRLLLCDCPGLVMPNFVASKAEMVTNGILPVDQMKDFLSPTAVICSLIPKSVFENIYGLILQNSKENASYNTSPYELLASYARIRGFMTHKGIPDCSRAARLILKDFVNGKLLYCSCPPNCTEEEYGSKPFDMNSVTEVKTLENLQTKDQTQLHGCERGVVNDIDEFVEKLSVKKNNNDSKKHYNKNKREKLRRLNKHLDA